MTTATQEHLEVDPLDYVRQRLDGMPATQLASVALGAGITERTIYNVMKAERDVKYGTVKKLYTALKEAEAAEAAAAKA